MLQRYHTVKYIFAFILFCIVIPFSSAQQTDGFSVLPDTVPIVDQTESLVKVKKKGSIFKGRPGKAALYSLILPGAGQIYNKSYFRVPFIYAAVGAVGYIMIDNTHKYKCFRDAYIAKIDGEPLNLSDRCIKKGGTLIQVADASTLRLARDQYNKNRQTAILGFALVWIANSIDAYVNAHLKAFDIDDDLSSRTIRINPAFETNVLGGPQVGLVISF